MRRKGRGHGRHTPEDTSGEGGAAYIASAVHFDTNGSLAAPAPLTGVVDGPTGFLSTWRKAGAQQGVIIDIGSTGRFYIEESGDGVLDIFLSDGASLWFGQVEAVISDNLWHSLLISWDVGHEVGQRIVQCFVDDEEKTATPIEDDGPAFSIGYVGTEWEIAEAEAPYDCSDTAVFLSGFLDLSVQANRRKFIDDDGKPVNPSEYPAGAAMLFSGDAAAFPVNQGSGGEFTLTGELTNASTSPSD